MRESVSPFHGGAQQSAKTPGLSFIKDDVGSGEASVRSMEADGPTTAL